MSSPSIHPSSYRDPSGFIYVKNGEIYRQVNQSFKEDFDHFLNSGLFDVLVKKGWLIPHKEVAEDMTDHPDHYKTLKPDPVAFVSYPYEWSFDMLKDAALLTLQLLRESLAYDMILKDATPFNIQWHKGKLVFIDTLSFERYDEKKPWIAYRQFCECFLSPLLLMNRKNVPLQAIQLAYPDGIPLALTSSLLPRKTRFSLHIYLHIHLHAKLSRRAKSDEKKKTHVFSRQRLENLIASLETLVQKLVQPEQQTTWSNYYTEASQRDDYLEKKLELVQEWVEYLPALKTGIDIGANDGEFSKILSQKWIYTLATDFDPYCINHLYTTIRRTGISNIQPLVIDLSNPSPAIGFNSTERASFVERVKVDVVLALAVIHHLAIGKNIPFYKIASLFKSMGTWLIVEFVPKTDEKIQLMLQDKRDIYTGYTEEEFLDAFGKYFTVEKRAMVGQSGRTLFLMKRNA